MKSIMKVLGLTLAAASAANAATAATKCNADNCARAVTGTLRAATASQFADCQIFLACTVTPSPKVVTITAATSLPSNNAPTDSVTICPTSVPTYASACSGSVRFSSACSCFGASRTTVTAPSPTITVVKSPEPTCDNQGLQWAYYPYNEGTSDYDPNVFTYDQAVIKTHSPSAQGLTDYIGLAGQDIYGDSLSHDYYILNHRGYVHAPETGTYNFTAGYVDDSARIWVGPQAYSGWNRDNGQQFVGFNDDSSVPHVYQMDLVAGSYTPFRLVYRSYNGPYGLVYSITAPSGLKIIGNDRDSAQYNPYMVQYSCDRTTATPFQPFGQET